ncbi:MAG TPA: hypothetical protein VF079_01300 [Sphingomicrobium sp.]
MEIFADHLVAWLTAAVLGVLTVFSDRILERIRFRLNRADIRAKYFEELAIDLSCYLFYAAIFEERYRRGWADDPDDLSAVAGEVNSAIATIRKKEFVYRAWARKYWNQKAADGLVGVFLKLAMLDDAIHAFNDRGDVKKKVLELGNRLREAGTSVETWLVQTS